MNNLNVTTQEGDSMNVSFTSDDCGGTTLNFDPWSIPERIRVDEFEDRIEMIYKETSMITYTVYPEAPPEERVFKIVFSCENGVWCKSERIYGEITEATQEYYEFNE